MKLTILAGGEGTRLYPITAAIPKPLIQVGGKPIISHIIEYFRQYRDFEIGVIITKKLENHFSAWRDEFANKEKITLFIEQKRAGTFSALRLVKEWVGKEDFLVANGDCLIDFDFMRLANFHAAHDGIATTPILTAFTSGDYSVPIMESFHITRIERKLVYAGNSGIVGGPYIFRPSIFGYDIPDRFILNIEADIFPQIINERKLNGVIVRDSRIFDCGTPENLELARREW